MPAINAEILDSQVFSEMRRSISNAYNRRSFPHATFHAPVDHVDWNLAIFLASALEDDGSSKVQEAVMDVSFGALEAEDSSDENKAAAALLLERVGNWPSLHVADQRQQIPDEYHRKLPLPLIFDSISSRIDHTITPASGTKFLGSRFQRRFWREAEINEWVSVSAPTSAGKSYIVKRWVIDQARKSSDSVVLYVVPTRALVDEVAKALLDESALDDVHIHTLPWDSNFARPGARILVMTQERVQMTFDKSPSMVPTAAFFDEAQKIGDGYRGILLEEVLQESVRRNSQLKVVFASPLTKNPEVLLNRSHPNIKGSALESTSPSVNQALYWLNPIPRKSPRWSISRAMNGHLEEVGEVLLDEEPSPKSKRLASLPASLAKPESLNIVYANGAADAEKCAKQLFEYLGPDADVTDEKIEELRDLIRRSIHPDYLLAQVIERGVAFHYGNMPQPVRNGIEDLYRTGLIKFLVCTSTLLEGVNLPCTNIWVMNPRRGKGNPMSAFDFWNLAGRAGRWGTEFSGNIVCIGTNDTKGWPDPPLSRSKGTVSFATESKLQETTKVEAFLRSDGEHRNGRKDEDMEALAAHLFDAHSRQVRVPGMNLIPSKQAQELSELVGDKFEEITIPDQVRRSHPGINPQAMQRLFADLQTKDPETLPLLSPHDDGSYERLVRVLARCERNMNAGFGTPGNQSRLATLLLEWMSGLPIPWLVSDKIKFERKKRPEKFNLANCIRSVLDDVEQIARYRAPKYLSCYADIVDVIAPRTEGEPARPDVTMMLELGVSRQTDVSLMSLGLSRTATVHISEFVARGDMTPEETLDWLRDQNLSSLGVPAMLVREIEEMLQRVLSRQNDSSRP